MAEVLNRHRSTIYTPNEEVLRQIRELYKIPHKGLCCDLMGSGTREEFEEAYTAVHSAVLDQLHAPTPRPGEAVVKMDDHAVRQRTAEGGAPLDPRQFVYQLDTKIDILVETMAATKKIEAANRVNLAAWAKVAPKDVEAACASNHADPELEQALSRACGFDTRDPAWRDPTIPVENRHAPLTNYRRRDTPANFRRHLHTVLNLGLGPSLVMKSSRVDMLDAKVASFALSDLGQETQADQPLSVFLEVDVSPVWGPAEYAYAIKKVYLRLVMDADSGIEIHKRLGLDGVATLSNKASLEARGTALGYYWELYVEEGVLNGEYSTREQQLFELLRAQQGMTFQAELSFQLYDGSLVRPDSKPLQKRSRDAIIERLMAKRTGHDVDASGWIVLGQQTLRIVTSDRK